MIINVVGEIIVEEEKKSECYQLEEIDYDDDDNKDEMSEENMSEDVI